eukprot:3839778-Rhodomonas_salina.1
MRGGAAGWRTLCAARTTSSPATTPAASCLSPTLPPVPSSSFPFFFELSRLIVPSHTLFCTLLPDAREADSDAGRDRGSRRRAVVQLLSVAANCV